VTLNKEEAEKALILFIQNSFSNFRPSARKHFSRLLFQHIKSPFEIEVNSGVKSIRVYGNFEFHINKHNILCPIKYYRRNKIKADAIYEIHSSNKIIIGEAKSSLDNTCFYPGSTFSCAHKIVDSIINEKNGNLDPDRKGFIKAFLSQSLGYIDAINQTIKFSSITYIMQLCPNSKINFSFAQDLYNLLPSQINYAFNQPLRLLTLGKSHVENENGVFYLIYDVNPNTVSMIIEIMAEKFVKKYLL
jgi:hypothetical protein